MARQAIVRSNVPMTIDAVRAAAPSVFAHHAREDRSERYTFIPTANVLEGLLKAGFEVFAAGQTITKREGGEAFARHTLRLRKAGQAPLRKVGDEFPEIVLLNSHDGTSAYQLIGGIYRLVCSNGMVLGRDFGEVKVRHAGNVIDNVIEGSFRVVEELNGLGDRVEQYSATQLSKPEQLLLAETAITARWGDNKVVTPEQVNTPQRWQDEGSDLWSTFNRIQENVTKGGQQGRAATGRRLKTRAVNSVSGDTNLNRALFELADGMAKLKAQ